MRAKRQAGIIFRGLSLIADDDERLEAGAAVLSCLGVAWREPQAFVRSGGLSVLWAIWCLFVVTGSLFRPLRAGRGSTSDFVSAFV